MAKISVIIPIYNVEKYLRECLESVINQTFENIEIICVNDGSTDNSLEILEEYVQKDNRIKVVSQKNQGQAVAKNKGIDIANGKYIFLLDSDDYIQLNTLESLYNKIVQTNADIVISQIKAFTHSSEENMIKHTSIMNKWFAQDNYIKDIKIDFNNLEFAINDISCIVCGRLYSANFLKKNNIKFINKNIINEDNGFWLKLCANLPLISVINDVGIMYRIREHDKATPNLLKKQKTQKRMHIILSDVLNYINTNFEKNIARKIISTIQTSKGYTDFFDYKFGFGCKFKWTILEKYLYLFKIRIFKIQQENNRININILGMKTTTRGK